MSSRKISFLKQNLRSRKTRSIALLLSTFTLFLVACATNPATGGRDFVTMSEDGEIAQGREYHPQVMQQYKEYESPELQALVKDVGTRLAESSERSHLIFRFTLLDSDQVNAFVAPGGKVVFYTGIVNKLNLTDAEIAAIMGHEMVHALEEHAKSKIGAQALTNIALNVGLSAAGNNVGQLGAAAAQLGTQIGIGLPYSRNLESRADQGGLMLMARAGYNPQAAITLWEKMNKLEGGGGASFLSTHPSNSQRIEAMRKNLPAAQALYNQSRR